MHDNEQVVEEYKAEMYTMAIWWLSHASCVVSWHSFHGGRDASCIPKIGNVGSATVLTASVAWPDNTAGHVEYLRRHTPVMDDRDCHTRRSEKIVARRFVVAVWLACHPLASDLHYTEYRAMFLRSHR